MPFRSIDHRTWFGWKTLNKASTPEAHTFIYASEPDAFRQPGLPSISELRALEVMFRRQPIPAAIGEGRTLWSSFCHKASSFRQSGEACYLASRSISELIVSA